METPRTATAAGDTHPTGMHSCLGSCYVLRYHFICVKLRKNVLADFETGVWLTLNNGRSSESGGWVPGGDPSSPPGRLLLRAVRILLECILV